MSINRDMKEYTLQQNIPAQTESGAGKPMWKNIRKIQVAVYKKNDMRVTASEKYLQSTHSGLIHCKKIRADEYRLVRDDVVYEITSCNTEGRLTSLLLKVVE